MTDQCQWIGIQCRFSCRKHYHLEPLESLRARNAEALCPVFDIESIKLGVATRPNETPSQVFDSWDGIRFIITREETAGKGIVLDVSAYPIEGTPQFHRVKEDVRQRGTPNAMGYFRRLAETRFRENSGDERPLEFVRFTAQKGEPHWVRKEALS